jgi:cellulose synthase operon protein C
MPEPLASQSHHPGRLAVNRLPPFALRPRLQGWEWFRRALKLLSQYAEEISANKSSIFARKANPMKKHPWSQIVILGLLQVGLLAGCSRDPNVRKQKYLESGQRYFAKQKYREASIQYLNAIQTDPRYAEAHYQLALCYLKMDLQSNAQEELLRTVDLQPENAKAQVDLGNLLLAGRQFQQARERAELVLRQYPNDADAHILLANSHAGLENILSSLEEMQAAVRLAPDRPRSYLNLAALQLNAQQVAAAEESFKTALQLDPRSIPALLALGNFYQAQSRWSDAESQFRRAIGLDPKNYLPRAALARFYLGLQKKAQAEQVLKEAKEALPNDPAGYRLLGDFYVAVGDLEKAVTEFGSLSANHPKDLSLKTGYVQLLILNNRQDELDEATHLNDEILRDNPTDINGLMSKGQLLSLRGRFNDAIGVLQAAEKTEPDNGVVHYQLGITFSLVGNLAQAETQWREAVRLRPDLIPAQKALAAMALRKGDMDLLRKSADQMVTSEPASPDGYILRASSQFWSGNKNDGEASLLKAIEVAPQSPSGYAQLAAWRMTQKRWSEAQNLYEQSLQRDPSSAEALQGLVALYQYQKQPIKALDRVNAQIAKVPNSSAFYLLQGLILVENKQLDQAERALEKAVLLDKNNVNAFFALAQLHIARGSLYAAMSSYRQAIAENPRNVRPYVLLAGLEDSRGNWQTAQDLYQKALQVEPGYPLAANNLAYLMLERGGNVDVALSLAQVARHGLPDLPSAADTLGWAYYQKQAYSLAIGLLEEATKKVPQSATYHYHLGLAYEKTGNKALAKQHLQQALQIEPKSNHADQINKTLKGLGGD